MPSETYDIAIIGGGTSVLLLETRLSEDSNLQVIVLENGEDRTADLTALTLGAWPLLPNSSTHWTFYTIPPKDLGRQITTRLGKALGGSRAINSFLLTSTPKETVGWKSLGNEGWNYATYKVALKRSFTLHKPLGVAEGEGLLQLTLAAPESLVRRRPSLAIRTGTTTTKVLLERSSSADNSDGASETIGVLKEVVISAGPINSLRLLELLGISGVDILEMDVLVDNPHVGEKSISTSSLNAFFRQEPDVVTTAMRDYDTRRTGPISMSNMITMAQLPLPGFHTEDGRKGLDQLLDTLGPDSEPSEAVGNNVFSPAYVPFNARSPTYRSPSKFVLVAVELSHLLSCGSVDITSAKPEHTGTDEGVSIDCRYLSHPLDLGVLARQIRFTEDIISRAEPDFVRLTADDAYHYTGMCSKMPRTMGRVVGNRLRVYRCSNLRMCGSIVYRAAELGTTLIKADMLWDRTAFETLYRACK
ncbi:hypothetical protein GGR58DRAFT_513064 [Xylaria digitata]|nr:hypothetical protein GGR58DRAFT_513064 [Xylaria digitata]